MAKTQKYSFKKTAYKFAKAAIYVIIAGLVVNYGDNPLYLAVAPLMAAIENYLKHK